MKTVYRTYKFRMYPDAEQRQILARYFGGVRFIYNHYLAERKSQYEQIGRSDSYSAQAKDLVALKRTEGFEWLKEINSQTLQQALMHLNVAYENFFRKQAQFPKFKSRKRGGSFTVPQFCTLNDGYVHIPKFKEGLRIKEHRKVKGVIRSMTISITPTGKYYVSILTGEQYEPMRKTNASVGLDLGITSLITTSEGETIGNNRYARQYERKLALAQKHLSRKQKGSHSWEKQRQKVALIHEKLANSRRDCQHKFSIDLVRRYDTICIEDLNVRQMGAARRNGRKNRLSGAIADAGWSSLVAMIMYKAQMNDKRVVKVGRYYPSSKTCGNCGYVYDALSLSERNDEYVTARAEAEHKSNCPYCAQMEGSVKTRIYKISEMDADHVTAWSRGGATDISNFWILDADICNWAGACRFYVGLAKEIKLLESPEFEEYVKQYLASAFRK